MNIADKIFYTQTNLDPFAVEKTVTEALQGMDDGELFLEYRQTESFSLDDGHIKKTVYDASGGFGLRAISEEAIGYAHASSIDLTSLSAAAKTIQAVKNGESGNVALPKSQKNTALLYTDVNPLEAQTFQKKVALLQEIDAYIRTKDARVKQVSASIAGSWQVVKIIRKNGESADDVRPLVQLSISVVMEENGRMERGGTGSGGREDYTRLFEDEFWKAQADEAMRMAGVNLIADHAPAGEMPVILGSGWPGILLHEAIGHGLEGDFNRKKTSVFSNLVGQKIAADTVTVIDDGSIEGRRGSLHIDDEGTPTSPTTLIENGVLRGYMQDRMNARLMGVAPTGNGRRQSFAHMPLPRMTNTYMLAGKSEKEELFKDVKKGLYAVNFGGGQVDIVSGKFVFSASEAYMIEDGKIGKPVKGATLIGNGFDALKKIKMVAKDLALDPGMGMCGKDGQSLPVGVGQPSLLIDAMTVGGTELS
ncbi:MAG: metalloprotease TldD [Alphaproteobacteria bacterium]